jgi:hypothetical protein
MFIPAAVYAKPTFQDVGGNNGEGGQFSVHGQRAADSGYNFEGMNQNMYGGDVYSYNAQMVQEVVVETGGTSAEAMSGGPQLNIIGKDGGNIFTGSYSTTFTGPSLASDNLTDERGLGAAERHLDQTVPRCRRASAAHCGTASGSSPPIALGTSSSFRAATTTSFRRCSTSPT